MRDLFRTLRRYEKVEYSLELLAAQTGLSQDSVLCAMRVFEQLGLLEMSTQPLCYKLLPSGKVSLENSMLRRELIRLQQLKK